MACARCGATTGAGGASGSRCPVCGYDPDARDRRAIIRRIAPPAEASEADRPPVPIHLPPTIAPGDIPGLSDYEQVRLEGRCQEAEIALHRGDDETARQALRRALEVTTLADTVWLFLAGLAANAADQRDHLEHALACNPTNQRALEALAALDGRLEPVADSGRRLAPGEVTTRPVNCPRCGGALDFDASDAQVVCRSCGYDVLHAADVGRQAGQTALAMGLLVRKQQARAWQIGSRWLRCGTCGAITTLSRATLTTTCRFCDSHQLVQEGVNLRFEQPDSILPFALEAAQADAAVRDHLRGGLRKLTRLFAAPVERIDLQDSFLPCWVFDAEMSVSWSWSHAPDHGQHPVLLGDVLHYAGESLPRAAVERLGPFDLLRSVDYDPRLLATVPAALYSVDVDRASLDVRPRLVRLAERQARPGLQARRPSRGYGGLMGEDRDPGTLRLHATTRSLGYRLALLPVWIAHVVEANGRSWRALVNGQSGAVAPLDG